ncbi:MAG TPA: hypothetical protein VF806_04200 [Anaerolineaceae bacterium]
MSSASSQANRLRRVYWLGGAPCSGKSSIASDLVKAYGLTPFSCDDAFYRHAKTVTAAEQPVFTRIIRYSPDELWMRPVEQQTTEEIEVYREEFPLIVADLLALKGNGPILAEGAALLPELVMPLLKDPRQAIWVVPTSKFHHTYYRQRAWARDVVSPCADPEQAFQNWMERDICFARYVCQSADTLGGRVLMVDGAQTIAENTALVVNYFNLKEDVLKG